MIIDGKKIRLRCICREWNTPKGCRCTSVYRVFYDGSLIGLAIENDRRSIVLPFSDLECSANNLYDAISSFINDGPFESQDSIART